MFRPGAAVHCKAKGRWEVPSREQLILTKAGLSFSPCKQFVLPWEAALGMWTGEGTLPFPELWNCAISLILWKQGKLPDLSS